MKAAAETRGPALQLLFADMDAAGPADATFVFGDFNEPSHRGLDRICCESGASAAGGAISHREGNRGKGFVDTFRVSILIRHQSLASPGLQPPSPSKEDHHDRIDFALARASNLTL